jgi:quinohemoprotein ethanol dehydrogenase
MFRFRSGLLVLAVATAIAPVSLRAGQQPARVDDSALRKAGAGDEWLTYGLNQSETRFSPLTDITTANVARLGLAWSYDAGLRWRRPGSDAAGVEQHHLRHHQLERGVRGGRAHRQGKVALGSLGQQSRRAAEICCGVVNRGLALYQGLIYVPVIDGRLQALDALTGRVVWESRVAFPQDHYTLTMAPRIAKGKVIIGASGGDRPPEASSTPTMRSRAVGRGASTPCQATRRRRLKTPR